MTPFDPGWPKMKFDTGNVFITSNYISTEVFMTQACMSHRERIFKSKSKIWPQMTPFDIWPLKVSMPNSSISKESIGAKKKLSKMVTCVRRIGRKFQFWKSIFSKFWIILELEMKILINFSTPRNIKNHGFPYHSIPPL